MKIQQAKNIVLTLRGSGRKRRVREIITLQSLNSYLEYKHVRSKRQTITDWLPFDGIGPELVVVTYAAAKAKKDWFVMWRRTGVIAFVEQ